MVVKLELLPELPEPLRCFFFFLLLRAAFLSFFFFLSFLGEGLRSSFFFYFFRESRSFCFKSRRIARMDARMSSSDI